VAEASELSATAPGDAKILGQLGQYGGVDAVIAK
jgi:hypothetical protein